MNDWDLIIELVTIAPSLVIIFILWKVGIIKFSGNGNGNGKPIQKQMDETNDRIDDQVQQMSGLKSDISVIKSDIAYIKGKLSKN
jgi:septal ring factor EnvC (AmiA/AmiB activator)